MCSRQQVGAFPGAAAQRHVCFVHFLRVSLDVFEVTRGLSDFKDRSTQVATVGIEIPRSIRRRMRIRGLHSTCCRVAVPVAGQLT